MHFEVPSVFTLPQPPLPNNAQTSYSVFESFLLLPLFCLNQRWSLLASCVVFTMTSSKKEVPTKLVLPQWEKNKCVYTACYCEENVWKLCEDISKNNDINDDFCYAIIISNQNKTVL